MSSAEREFSRVALLGNPNSGKSALFNSITGDRQKVGNYPGVTVERKEGWVSGDHGRAFSILDLPGTYSLTPRSPDEEITHDVLLGRLAGERHPEAVIAVADATNLERGLNLVLELKDLGVPVVLALNMMDLANQRGQKLDLEILKRELGVPVIPTVATRGEGVKALVSEVGAELLRRQESIKTETPGLTREASWHESTDSEIRARFKRVDGILKAAIVQHIQPASWSDKIDRIVLHPVWGVLLLVAVLVAVFQAIFTLATIPQDWIKSAITGLGALVTRQMGEGPLQSLIVDGIIAGVGSVVVFLPQILILFGLIVFLEDTGYMARAAFLMDRLMGKVGLNGRAFIPLLSSYACAIPGIMATRTIAHPRDRLVTILIAPLMTCAARLPVYTLLVAAFIPDRAVLGPLRLPGLVMFGLYASGIIAALIMAVFFRKTMLKGAMPPLLLELPTYRWPNPSNVLRSLVERSRLFLERAGTVILGLSILLWFLASYPKAPVNAVEPPIYYSAAGQIGRVLQPVFAPIGFNWQISVALIPGFAAREVMVGALATVYAVSGGEGEAGAALLGTALSKTWTLATALSLLMWYVLAPQCMSTLAVVRRETNSWKWPLVMLVYMTALAYAASFVVYHGAVALGWG